LTGGQNKRNRAQRALYENSSRARKNGGTQSESELGTWKHMSQESKLEFVQMGRE